MNFEESVEINLLFFKPIIARLCLWVIADQKTPLEEGTILPLIDKWTKQNPCSRISLKTAWKETKKTVNVDWVFMFKPKGSALSCHQPEYPYSESTSVLIPFQGFKLCRHPREYKVCLCCCWAHWTEAATCFGMHLQLHLVKVYAPSCSISVLACGFSLSHPCLACGFKFKNPKNLVLICFVFSLWVKFICILFPPLVMFQQIEFHFWLV